MAVAGVIAMAPRDPLAERDEIGPGNLAGRPMIGLAPEDRARHGFDAILEGAGVAPDYVVEPPSSTTTCALALSGDAVGLVNPLVLEGFAARGLVVRPFAPKVTFRLFLPFRPDAQRSRLVRDFATRLFDMRNAMV